MNPDGCFFEEGRHFTTNIIGKTWGFQLYIHFLLEFLPHSPDVIMAAISSTESVATASRPALLLLLIGWLLPRRRSAKGSVLFHEIGETWNEGSPAKKPGGNGNYDHLNTSDTPPIWEGVLCHVMDFGVQISGDTGKAKEIYIYIYRSIATFTSTYVPPVPVGY